MELNRARVGSVRPSGPRAGVLAILSCVLPRLEAVSFILVRCLLEAPQTINESVGFRSFTNP